MSMSKKDFIRLADVIRTHNQSGEESYFWETQINLLADFCAASNPGFKRERWIGYIAGTNGPNGGRLTPVGQPRVRVVHQEPVVDRGAMIPMGLLG